MVDRYEELISEPAGVLGGRGDAGKKRSHADSPLHPSESDNEVSIGE